MNEMPEYLKGLKSHVANANVADKAMAAERNNILFFHATCVAPKWSSRLSRQFTIGNHIFYALNH